MQISPLVTRAGVLKNWDSVWCQNLSVSSDFIHYSICNRKTVLKKLLGKKNYQNVINKVK